MNDRARQSGPVDVSCVVGARPNFMKMAPIMRAFAERAPQLRLQLVHTGQHYDQAMNQQFFDVLGIARPDVNLEVGSGSHARQTADVMTRFEAVLQESRSRSVLVVGDVNSSLACALVAAKEGVPVIHVEAGLRSRDRSMPEEINRVLTDSLSELLFATEPAGVDNLLQEGIARERIHHVGNVMIDSLLAHLDRAVPFWRTAGEEACRRLDLRAGGYALLTLHRPSNVDDPRVLRALLGVLAEVSSRLPVLLPLHPRTAAMLERHQLQHLLGARVVLLPPAGYLEMLGLMRDARMVLTDSGGVQEETTALGVPCLTLRDSTERPVTLEQGTNTLVGTGRRAILRAVDEVLETGGRAGRIPDLWDGHAAPRIAEVVSSWLADDNRRM